MRSRGRDGGFTLIEIAIVVLVVGILAGIAIPNVRSALFRADAAHLVSDAHTIELAAYEYLSENGRFPPSGGSWGEAPDELAALLPGDFEFGYKDVDYRWFSIDFSFPILWGSSKIGILYMRYIGQDGIAEAMQAHAGPRTFWTSTQTIFIYTE